MAELRRIPEADRMDRMADAVYSTGLEGHLARPIGELSKGLRQRVGLAQAILHKPQILILDEPTIGLDPTQVVEVRHLIRRLALESTVLFSTHILSEVEALCDRVIILINGRVKADAKLSELASASDAILVLDEERSGLEEQLMGLDQVRAVESGNTPAGHPYYRVIGTTPGAGEALCPQIYRIAVEQSWPVRELKQDERTLEAIFNQLATSR
jgi:ABC-2 type transport system ATP-binding protein